MKLAVDLDRAVVRETAYGKWLAQPNEECVLRIAVIGDTEEDARARLSDSVAAWRRILAGDGDADAVLAAAWAWSLRLLGRP